jgi:hypothetical protein
VFKAGLCLYGVSNLFTLVQDTHKFEQHYNDSLLAHYRKRQENIMPGRRFFTRQKFKTRWLFFREP